MERKMYVVSVSQQVDTPRGFVVLVQGESEEAAMEKVNAEIQEWNLIEPVDVRITEVPVHFEHIIFTHSW